MSQIQPCNSSQHQHLWTTISYINKDWIANATITGTIYFCIASNVVKCWQPGRYKSSARCVCCKNKTAQLLMLQAICTKIVLDAAITCLGKIDDMIQTWRKNIRNITKLHAKQHIDRSAFIWTEQQSELITAIQQQIHFQSNRHATAECECFLAMPNETILLNII